MPLIEGFTPITRPLPSDYDRPVTGDIYEVGRQLGAGIAVDLPRMVGQGMRRLAPDGSRVDQWGRAIVENADERAAGWEPNTVGEGPIAGTLSKGARAVGPMVPALATLPLGGIPSALTAAATFGLSQAQDTEDKLRLQGVDDTTAFRAGIGTGAIQGLGEAAANYFTAGLFKALKPAGKGMAGLLDTLTDARTLKPFAAQLAKTYPAEIGTEVAQDVGTEFVERAAGAAPEDAWEIAKNSAQGAAGLTTLLAPFGLGAHKVRARQAQMLDFALNDPNASPQMRAMAVGSIERIAKQAKVDPQEIAAWVSMNARPVTMSDGSTDLFGPGEATPYGHRGSPDVGPVPPMAAMRRQQQGEMDFAAPGEQGDMFGYRPEGYGVRGSPNVGPPAPPVGAPAGRQFGLQLGETPGRGEVSYAAPGRDTGLIARDYDLWRNENAQYDQLDAQARRAGPSEPAFDATPWREHAAAIDAELSAQPGLFNYYEPQAPAPTAQPPGVSVRGVQPGQVELFGERGQPSYEADQGDNASIAEQTRRLFRIQPKVSAKNLPIMAEMGRLYFDGTINEDEAAPIVAALDKGRYAAAAKQLAALKTEVAARNAAQPAALPRAEQAAAPAEQAAAPAPVVEPPVQAAPAVETPPVEKTPAVKHPKRDPEEAWEDMRDPNKHLAWGKLDDTAKKQWAEAVNPPDKGALPFASMSLAQLIHTENSKRQRAIALGQRMDSTPRVMGEVYGKKVPARLTQQRVLKALSTFVAAGRDTSEKTRAYWHGLADLVMLGEAKTAEEGARETLNQALELVDQGDVQVLRASLKLKPLESAAAPTAKVAAPELKAAVKGARKGSRVDNGKGKGEIAEASGNTGANRDLRPGISTPMDPDAVPKDGRALVRILADRMDRSWMRHIARVIAPYISENLEVHVIEPGYRVPTMVANRMMTAAAVYYQDRDTGHKGIYIWKDEVTEETLLHELIHNATLNRLNASSELYEKAKALGRQISSSILSAVIEKKLPFDEPAMQLLARQLRNPQELLTYSFSSPTFRELTDRMAADGQFFDAYRTPAQEAKVNRNAGLTRQRVPDVPRYTMTKRIADFIRGLFGLEPKYRAEIERLRDAAEQAIKHNARAKTVEFIPLQETLRSFLDEVLAAPETAAETGASDAGQRQEGADNVAGGIRFPAAFWKWFGDSKVVDKNGAPLVVYHGTASNVGSFRGDRAYFTPSREYANDYADNPEGGNVLPVFLSIQNPVDLRSLRAGDVAPATVWSTMEAAGVRLPEELKAEYKGATPVWAYLHDKRVREAIKASGFDGIVLSEYNGFRTGDAYITFSPTQIKSAIGNNGEYSSSNTDIAAQEAGTATAEPEKRPRGLTESVKSDLGFELPAEREAQGLKERLADLVTNTKANARWLGAMTLRQIGDVYEKHPNVRTYVEKTQQMVARARQLQGEAFAIDTKWRAMNPAQALELQRLMIAATLNRSVLTEDKDTKANEHLSESERAEHDKLRAQLNKLVREDPKALEVYVEARKKMRDDWNERGKWLKQRIIESYRPELTGTKVLDVQRLGEMTKKERDDMRSNPAAMRHIASNEAVRRSVISLFDDLDEHDTYLQSVPGDYFPLVRFGKHVVTLKSHSYDTAMSLLDSAKKELHSIYQEDQPIKPTEQEAKAYKERVAAARKAVRVAGQAVEDVKARPQDYAVLFFETKAAANRYAKDLDAALKAEGREKTATVAVAQREAYVRSLDSASPQFMRRLEDAIKSSLPTKDASAVEGAVRDLIKTSMPERSALKQELRRLGVRGAKPAEMRRAFAFAAVRNSWHISRLQFGNEMHDALSALRTSDDDTQKVIGDELAKRFVQSMTIEESSPILQGISSLTYLSFLGMSPSFLVMNMTQPWVISAPLLAQRYGMYNASAELGKAFVDTGKAMTQAMKEQGVRFELKMSQFKDAGERQMLEELFNRGIIDITLEHDVGAVASGQGENALQKVTEWAALPAHHTEVVNRVMTALAAYRLAKRANISDAEATRYAERIVHESHLDYTSENAPRLFKSLGPAGRLVFQFKKYAQGVLYLLLKNMKQVVTAQGVERREAAKTLAYISGMQWAVAGMYGLPFAWVVGALSSALSMLWPDDDEPDLKESFKQGLESVFGEHMTRLILKGVPAVVGVDLSARMGMGDLGNPLAFNKANKEGRDWWAYTLMSWMGPSMSLAGNYADAMAKASHGDFMGASIAATPKFIADPLRAIRQHEQGLRTAAGNQIIKAEDVSAADEIIRALGASPSVQSEVYERRASFEAARSARDSERSRIIQRVLDAGLGDPDAREEVQAFNSRHSDYPILPQNLIQARAARLKYQQESIQGVRVQRRDRQLALERGLIQQ